MPWKCVSLSINNSVQIAFGSTEVVECRKDIFLLNGDSLLPNSAHARFPCFLLLSALLMPVMVMLGTRDGFNDSSLWLSNLKVKTIIATSDTLFSCKSIIFNLWSLSLLWHHQMGHQTRLILSSFKHAINSEKKTVQKSIKWNCRKTWKHFHGSRREAKRFLITFNAR